MFEIGAIEYPGRQDRHAGGFTPGRQVLKGTQQMGGIVVDRLNSTALEQAREQPFHHPTVFEVVGHPRWTTQVVFQDTPGAIAIADQVEPGDVAPTVEGQVDALHLRSPTGGTFHVFPWDHTVVEDLLGAIDVGEEAVDGFQALQQSPLQGDPVAAADQPGQGIEGENPFTAFEAGIVQAKGGAQATQQLAG